MERLQNNSQIHEKVSLWSLSRLILLDLVKIQYQYEQLLKVNEKEMQELREGQNQEFQKVREAHREEIE